MTFRIRISFQADPDNHRSASRLPARASKLVKWICIYRRAESFHELSAQGLQKVLLTRARARLVATIPAVVDEVADFVEGEAVPVAALKLTLPAGKHRRRRENAGANQPMHT